MASWVPFWLYGWDFVDDFTGVDADPWNTSRWTVSAINGATAPAILTNRGRLVTNVTLNSTSRAIAKHSSIADTELLLSFQLDSITEDNFLRFAIRGLGTWTTASPNESYFVSIDALDAATGFELTKRVSAVNTTLATTSWGRTTGKYWLRFQAVGTAIKARVWLDGTTEPSTWALSGITRASRFLRPIAKAGSGPIASL